MSDQPDSNRDEALARRRAGISSSSRGGAGRTFGIFAFLLLFGFATFWVVAPDTVASWFCGRTSDNEEMQRTYTTDPGINTEITIPSIDTDVPERTVADIPAPEAPATPIQTGPSQEELERIAQLEERIQELIDAQTNSGVDPEELRLLLEEQANVLREEFERQQAIQQQLYDQQLQLSLIHI